MGSGQEPYASLTPTPPSPEPTHNFTFNRDLISTTPASEGSEFGGVPGLIQPPPHSLTPSEILQQIHNIDPSDDGTHEDSIVIPNL